MVVLALKLAGKCNTADDGTRVSNFLRPHLKRGERINLSFEGVYDVPSSFVNTVIVLLFSEFGDEFVRSHLKITHATRQIADMIRRCVANGSRKQNEIRKSI